MDYSQPDLPLAPPPPPTTVAKRRPPVALLAVIGVLALVAGSLVALLVTWDSSATTVEVRAGSTHAPTVDDDSPAPTPSPVGTTDRAGRIQTIISDAHSGRYFANDFADTYPAAFERGIVKGMTWSPDSKLMSDEFLACMLSYIESYVSADDLVVSRSMVERFGRKAAIGCIKLGVN